MNQQQLAWDLEDVQIYRRKVRELHAALVTAREAEALARSEHAKARNARKDAEHKLQAFLERDSVPLPLFDRPQEAPTEQRATSDVARHAKSGANVCEADIPAPVKQQALPGVQPAPPSLQDFEGALMYALAWEEDSPPWPALIKARANDDEILTALGTLWGQGCASPEPTPWLAAGKKKPSFELRGQKPVSGKELVSHVRRLLGISEPRQLMFNQVGGVAQVAAEGVSDAELKAWEARHQKAGRTEYVAAIAAELARREAAIAARVDREPEDAAARGLTREALNACHVAQKLSGTIKEPPLVTPVALDGKYWVCVGSAGTAIEITYDLWPLVSAKMWRGETRLNPVHHIGMGGYEGVRVRMKAGRKVAEEVIGYEKDSRRIRWRSPEAIERAEAEARRDDGLRVLALRWPDRLLLLRGVSGYYYPDIPDHAAKVTALGIPADFDLDELLLHLRRLGEHGLKACVVDAETLEVLDATPEGPSKRFCLPFDTEDLLAWPTPPALQVRLSEIFAAEGFPPMPSPVADALAAAQPELRTLADLLRAAYLLEDVAADLRLRIMSVCKMAGLIEGHRVAAADRVLAVAKDLDWPSITSSYPAWGEFAALLSPPGPPGPALTYGAGQVDTAIQSLTGKPIVARVDGRNWKFGDELPGLGLVVAIQGQHGHLLGQCRAMRTAQLGNGRIEVKARCPTAAMGNWGEFLAEKIDTDDRYPTCEEIEDAVARDHGEGLGLSMLRYEECAETKILEFVFRSTDEILPDQKPALTKKGRVKR